MREFELFIANIEDFQNKKWENFDTNNTCLPENAQENKLPNWFTYILTLKYGRTEVC